MQSAETFATITMKKILFFAVIACFLGACGGTNGRASGDLTPSFFASTINFLSGTPAAEVKTYAASRFLDHASFGPHPDSIAELKALGIPGWIDAQFALPASQIDGTFSEDWDASKTPDNLKASYYEFFTREFINLMLSGKDQLRLRTTLALSQFIVVTEGKVQSFATIQYFNLLQNNSLGNFSDLIRAIVKSHSMASFLDNISNVKEGACANCSVNENFSRELMQLFTLGLTQLNQDGSAKRDVDGKLLETYTQDDVQAMARAMTGWTSKPPFPPGLRNSFYRYPLAGVFKDMHDTGEKQLLGKIIPAGGTAEQDLESVVAILMAHPNLAPFISLRMIQHLVTSNPSPAYISRMTAVFNNNGSDVRGDMKALVRAILLDPEARRADDPALQDNSVGKIREPILFFSAVLRGLQCSSAMRDVFGITVAPSTQSPFNPPTVFGFYPPNYTAPGSQIMAPELKLITSQELSYRYGNFLGGDGSYQFMTSGGCKLDEFAAAYDSSKRDFLNLVDQRYFRGSMPPTLRKAGTVLLDQASDSSSQGRVMDVLKLLLISPAFGVIL